MAEKENPQADKANVAATPEMSDEESNNLIEKVMNAFKEGEVPVVESKEAELTDKLLRLQAEFENYRKRMEKDRIENAMNANSILVSQLLDVIDHFELALKHNHDKGVQMIHDELLTILERQGLKRIPIDGKFDPRIHEAVIKVEGKQDGMILEELQKGYLLNERLLRASKVKISKVTEKK